LGTLVWKQLPQIEDAVPMSPNEGAGDPAAYLGAAGEDALTRSSQRFSVTEGKEERRITIERSI
jgi:hypothetical protein